jgi:mRNA interferase MazF
LKRGDIVLVREPATPAAKPRPCVIVQRDAALENPRKVTVCSLTTQLRGPAGQRPLVVPGAESGLRLPSEVQVDWVFTHPIDCIGHVIGRLDEETRDQVDIALRRWLDL